MAGSQGAGSGLAGNMLLLAAPVGTFEAASPHPSTGNQPTPPHLMHHADDLDEARHDAQRQRAHTRRGGVALGEAGAALQQRCGGSRHDNQSQHQQHLSASDMPVGLTAASSLPL